MLELVIYDISTITLDVVIAGMFFFFARYFIKNSIIIHFYINNYVFFFLKIVLFLYLNLKYIKFFFYNI